MRILVIGAGGREHAMLWAMARGGELLELFCAPGNAGIEQVAQCVPIQVTDVTGLAQFAQDNRIDLTIAGGETSLAVGVADEFARRGLPFAGATQAAARLESSKAFSKDFFTRHRIPTAHYRVADTADKALGILQRGEFGDESAPTVVKVDGLAAGKGVVVARSRAEASAAVKEMFAAGATRLVLEETLTGREASLLVFADGRDYVVMPPARDHKRIGENDTGRNTGGMGAVTDEGILDPAQLQAALSTVIEPALAGAAAEGFPFRGVLFAGLMLTPDGIQTLEFNVRFGDPEAQAILVRLNSSLVSLFEGVSRGSLAQTKVEWDPEPSACVVLAARGYPGKPETGAVINGLDQVSLGVQVFHAGTACNEIGEYVTNGGRVLGVTATGTDLPGALSKCYAAVGQISWEGMQFRRDIGRGLGVRG
ncbi:MAG: phosphoribosylamine--glycine ligase [Pyrinomonadaceae bacterium]